GPQPSPCAANIRGGSQAVTTERDSMPGPKSNFTATGFPSRISNAVGTNQDEIPGPVAMACQTSSGVPGTSTSTWTERRPEASFFTLMMTPWDRISAAEGAPRPPGDARGRRGRIHRDISKRVLRWPVRLQRVEMVVDLLPSQANPRGQRRTDAQRNRHLARHP